MVRDTLATNKDLFIEKPLTHTVKEGEKLLKAARDSKSLVQVGTQRRSSPLYAKAREIYQSGILGKVTMVRAFWHRNSLKPQWRYPIPEDASPETCNGQAFLSPARKRPWDPVRMFQWRLYWDYSAGVATDLMTHQLDAIQMITAETAPRSLIAQGGIYLWNDGREVPDTWHSVLKYPGFTVDYTSMFGNNRFGYGEQFLGSEGTLEIINMRTLNFTPERFTRRGQDITPEKIRSCEAITIQAQDLGPLDSTVLHLKNFFDSVRSGQPTNCPLAVGEQAVTPSWGRPSTIATPRTQCSGRPTSTPPACSIPSPTVTKPTAPGFSAPSATGMGPSSGPALSAPCAWSATTMCSRSTTKTA